MRSGRKKTFLSGTALAVPRLANDAFKRREHVMVTGLVSRIIMGLFITALGLMPYGCATVEEVEALKQTMNEQRFAAEQRMKMLDEYGKQTEEKLEQYGKQTEERHARLQKNMDKNMEESMANVSELNRRFQTALSSFKSVQRALSNLLDAQESFHRDGLRSLQGVRHDLALERNRSDSNERAEARQGIYGVPFDEP
jgi:exonuclease VII large subunit